MSRTEKTPASNATTGGKFLSVRKKERETLLPPVVARLGRIMPCLSWYLGNKIVACLGTLVTTLLRTLRFSSYLFFLRGGRKANPTPPTHVFHQNRCGKREMKWREGGRERERERDTQYDKEVVLGDRRPCRQEEEGGWLGLGLGGGAYPTLFARRIKQRRRKWV